MSEIQETLNEYIAEMENLGLIKSNRFMNVIDVECIKVKIPLKRYLN